MQESFTSVFFLWSKENSISKEDIADALNKGSQTISNWKSAGIPKGQKFACQAFMAQHERDKKMEEIQNCLVFNPSQAQFLRWNNAALKEGKTIEDWAFDGLEQIADELLAPNELLAVAEKKAPYDSCRSR